MLVYLYPLSAWIGIWILKSTFRTWKMDITNSSFNLDLSNGFVFNLILYEIKHA